MTDRLEEIIENWFDEKDPLWLCVRVAGDPEGSKDDVNWLIREVRRLREERKLLARVLRATLHYAYRALGTSKVPRHQVWLRRDALAAHEDWEAYLADRLKGAAETNRQAEIEVVLS